LASFLEWAVTKQQIIDYKTSENLVCFITWTSLAGLERRKPGLVTMYR